jgi:hypothetical protein
VNPRMPPNVVFCDKCSVMNAIVAGYYIPVSQLDKVTISTPICHQTSGIHTFASKMRHQRVIVSGIDHDADVMLRRVRSQIR